MHPAIKAIEEALSVGSGAICRRNMSIELVRFTNSGTEANLMALTAIRLASVPELVKRTSSIDGKRSQIACGKFRLGEAVRAEIDPAVERRVDRLADRRMRMAVKPGGELAEEIGVFVPVSIPQMRTLALHHRQRERLGIDRRARVAARHRGASRFVERGRLFGLRVAVLLLGFGKAASMSILEVLVWVIGRGLRE